MKQVFQVALALMIVVAPLSPVNASRLAVGEDVVESAYSDPAPGTQRSTKRCVAVEDTYIYKLGDPDLPTALASIENLRASQSSDEVLLHRGQLQGELLATEVIALKVNVRAIDCSERVNKSRGDRSRVSGKSGDSLMAAPGECDYAGCVHPNPPPSWDWMLPGSSVRTEACSIDLVGNIRLEITRYERRESDGKWVMTYYRSELRVECPPMS